MTKFNLEECFDIKRFHSIILYAYVFRLFIYRLIKKGRRNILFPIQCDKVYTGKRGYYCSKKKEILEGCMNRVGRMLCNMQNIVDIFL